LFFARVAGKGLMLDARRKRVRERTQGLRRLKVGGLGGRTVERRRKEAERRDTECAEIRRRRDRNRFRGKGAACPSRIASRLPSELRVNRTSSVNRVKGKPFEAPFLFPFGSQGKQGKRGKHREW
jgi:hypothetical protein